jgi:hypothetical protein
VGHDLSFRQYGDDGPNGPVYAVILIDAKPVMTIGTMNVDMARFPRQYQKWVDLMHETKDMIVRTIRRETVRERVKQIA